MEQFDNQIQERRWADQQALEDSYVRIARIVIGDKNTDNMINEQIITKNAIDDILKYYRFKPLKLPDGVVTADEQLDYCLRPYGLMRRNVELTEGWYKDAYGPILAFTREDSLPVALLPGKAYGYYFIDPVTGKPVLLNKKTSSRFRREAVCFYRPLPQKKLRIVDLMLYMKSCLNLGDISRANAAAIAVTLIGLAMPQVTRFLTGPVLQSGQSHALIGISVCIICISLSTRLIETISNFMSNRLNTKITLGVEASIMMRLLSFPTSFFRGCSPGEMKTRSGSVSQLCSNLMSILTSTTVTSLTSLVYIGQIFSFSADLVIPSIIIALVTVAFSIVTTFLQIKYSSMRIEYTAKESGMSYSLISGIQKIKLAGAEKRVFAKWLNIYSDGAEITYNKPVFLKFNSFFSKAISLASTIVFYYIAVKSELTPSVYYAFMASFGMLIGSCNSLSGVALFVAQVKPIWEMAEPFLKTEPETTIDQEIITKISGDVEMNHVSFRYADDMPYVLNDLSLKIKSGEYVAVVGKSGCGKSTLIRLLLGFEKPERGAVLYDNRNINSLNLPSLRRMIGTVMQNADLFQGSIYSNIAITAPELSLSEAWEAAETAGIADDIRAMPMGMHTVIGEGQGGISGGQKQRLMIARAIASKPKLLIFDEATSALDNKTQKQVSEALDSMGCTRLVIAHRLSTIRHCDRILVLDGGHIIEDGTYDELVEKKGFFAELIERQQLDTAECSTV